MSASYPASAKIFAAINPGDVVLDTLIESAYDEITAVETELVTTGLTNTLLVNAGVKFPAVQAASSNVNTLDDYEEGTFTPAIGGQTSATGQTYTTQTGAYVKVGKLVYVEIHILLSAKGTITGDVLVSGLPFSDGSAGRAVFAVQYAALATNWVNVVGRLANTSTILLQGATAAGVANTTGLAEADLNNTSLIRISGQYIASA